MRNNTFPRGLHFVQRFDYLTSLKKNIKDAFHLIVKTNSK